LPIFLDPNDVDPIRRVPDDPAPDDLSPADPNDPARCDRVLSLSTPDHIQLLDTSPSPSTSLYAGMAVGDTQDMVPYSTLPDLFPSQLILVHVQYAASPSFHSQLIAYQCVLSRRPYLGKPAPRNIHDHHARNIPPGMVDIADLVFVVRDSNHMLVGIPEEAMGEVTATERIDVERDFLRKIPVIVDPLEEAFLNVVDSN